MRRSPALLAALAALLSAGCLHPASMPVNLLSHAEFPPSERDEVWSRALTSMHGTGLLTTTAQGQARVVQTDYPTSKTQCRRRKCDVVGTLQVVLTPSGTLSARYNRTFSGKVDIAHGGGWERLLLEEDVAQLQRELDAWVAWVVEGKTPAK